MEGQTGAMLYLDALAWKANQLGTTYGKLSAALTPEEAEAAVAEYRAMCCERREEEELRLRRSKEKRAGKK